MIRVCCVCQRVERDGLWREGGPEEGCALTHGLCPICFDEAMETVREMKAHPAPERRRRDGTAQRRDIWGQKTEPCA